MSRRKEIELDLVRPYLNEYLYDKIEAKTISELLGKPMHIINEAINTLTQEIIDGYSNQKIVPKSGYLEPLTPIGDVSGFNVNELTVGDWGNMEAHQREPYLVTSIQWRTL